MTADRFGLSDVRFYGHHGAAEHERQVGQWFSADVELHCDLGRAGASDDLAATVDYRDAARLVMEIGSGEPAQLLGARGGSHRRGVSARLRDRGGAGAASQVQLTGARRAGHDLGRDLPHTERGIVSRATDWHRRFCSWTAQTPVRSAS